MAMHTALRVFFLMTLLSASLSAGQSTKEAASLTLPVDKNIVVRFFYLPANDYLHPALIFRVAGAKSQRLNTAPITNHGGRTPYISIKEMQSLIKMLDRSGLAWRETKTVEVPKMVGFRETTGKLEIKIFSSGERPCPFRIPKRSAKPSHLWMQRLSSHVPFGSSNCFELTTTARC